MTWPNHFLRSTTAVIALIVVGALFCVTCSNNSPTSSDDPVNPHPNPDGVLLQGNSNDNAFNAITVLPPSPASSSDILPGGLLLTRLEAVFNPNATVGQVNSLLQTNNARIICMHSGSPLVTLKTPRMANRQSVDSLISVLKGNVLSFVSYAFMPVPGMSIALTADPLQTYKVGPGGEANSNMEHLISLKMPAAWNLKDASQSNVPITVFVPDQYASLNAHPNIPSQSFLPGGNAAIDTFLGTWTGNHGFHVCGIIGAAFDSMGATGVHPTSAADIRIQSLPLGGFSFNDVGVSIAVQIATRFPTTRFIMNTSIGYNDTGFVNIPKAHRAFLMLSWRALVGARQSQFFHAASAGNDGLGSGDSKLAAYNSPWNSGCRFLSPRDMLSGVMLTPAEDSAFDGVVAAVTSASPAAANLLTNVIMVGNNQGNGAEDPASSRNPDVRCVGELVFSTCVQVDPSFPPALAIGCKGDSGWYSGTSQASPQVAGLAAYLWTLNAALSVSDLADIIVRADINSQVDAYAAVQQLDHSLSTSSLRLHLIDVANQSGDSIPDGSFTTGDISLFLEKFRHFEQQRGGGTDPKDFSRYDLNGDGVTGDSTAANGVFDLDVNVPQSMSNVSQSIRDSIRTFDENHLTDYDILCYYGYSTLFTGDSLLRDSLLPCGVTSDTTIDTTLAFDLTGNWGISLSWVCPGVGTGSVSGTADLVQSGSNLSGSGTYTLWTTTCASYTGTGTFTGTVIPGIDLQGQIVGAYVKNFVMQSDNPSCGTATIVADSLAIELSRVTGGLESVSGVASGELCPGSSTLMASRVGFSRRRP